MKANQKAVNVVEWLINLIMFYHTHIHNEFSIAQKFLGLKSLNEFMLVLITIISSQIPI